LYAPWSNYFRLGLVHFMAYPQVGQDESQVLPTIAEVAADSDFEVLEVRGVSDPALRVKIKELCRSAHLDLAYAAQPLMLGRKLNPNSLDAAERQEALKALKAAVDEAYELGAQGFALLSGPDPGDAKRAEGMAYLVESLVELCRYSKSKGDMPIVLEVFDRSIEKKAIAGPTVEAVEMAKAVKAQVDNFGLMIDLSHLPLLNETPEEALTAAAGYMVHAHIGNAVMRDTSHPAYGDQHPRFGIPGGENDVAELAEFLRWLFRTGYLADGKNPRPIVSFEVKPLAGESSAAVIAGSKRALAAAWAQV